MTKKIETRKANKWPYRKSEYIYRIFWGGVYRLIWPFLWKRIPVLRTFVLKLFGAEVDGTIQISASARIYFPWHFKTGNCNAIGDRVHIYNLGGVELGEEIVISQDVYLCGGTHDYTSPTYPLIRKKILIQNGVWICAGAFIGPGVTIGEGAIVGARSVVTQDVEPWTVVAGNPARKIKQRVIHGE